MEWLLWVGLMMYEPDFEPALFETRTECMAAAEAFVEQNPIFEWEDRPRELHEPIYLVLRPTVICVRAGED